MSSIESRLNESIVRHMANADCDIPGGPTRGIFRRESVDVLGGIGMVEQTDTLRVVDFPGSSALIGVDIGIDELAWHVADIRPDSSGMIKLILEKT